MEQQCCASSFLDVGWAAANCCIRSMDAGGMQYMQAQVLVAPLKGVARNAIRLEGGPLSAITIAQYLSQIEAQLTAIGLGNQPEI